MPAPLVRMRGITKRFPGVVADDHVDLDLSPGHIHALLGENGAGKTTLMNVLAGLYRPDAGEIYIGEQRVEFESPAAAIRAGVGMVHQHFQLVETFSVLENLSLGYEGLPALGDPRRLSAEIGRLAKEHGLHVHPSARVWQLSVGERQRVEIIRLLHRRARVLILDEPTAVLTPQEAIDLFQGLRRLATAGAAVVLITHKLDEVMAIADDVTVLRGGRVVATVDTGATNVHKLARLMVGRDVAGAARSSASTPGPAVLEARQLTAIGDRGLAAISDVSLDVHAGELVGIAGIAGNGQRELAEVLAAVRPSTSGRLTIDGRDVTRAGVRGRLEAGMAYIPEDRLGTGLVPELGLIDNAIMRCYRRPPVRRGWLIDRANAERWTSDLLKRAFVASSRLGGRAGQLSGGNMQRLLVGRELATQPRVLVAAQPTRGLDVAATAMIQQLLVEQCQNGAGVLLMSEDLDEVLRLSDRVLVMFGGRIVGEARRGEADRGHIGLLMGGSKRGVGELV